MEESRPLSEASFERNETPRIRGLRVLASMIVRDLMKNQRNAKKDNGAAGNEPQEGLPHDKGLSGT